MGSLRLGIVALVLVMSGDGFAATVQVGPTRLNTTLSQGLSNAGNGDIIVLEDGVYDEEVFIGAFANLTIESFSGDPNDVTIVSPGDDGADSLVLLVNSTVTIRGITIDGAFERRGILIRDSTLSLEGSVVLNGVNPDGYPGAGLDIYNGSSAIISDSTFYGSISDDPMDFKNYGGNIAVEDGCSIDILPGTVIIYGEAEHGGGLWLDERATAMVDGAQFVSNTATGIGDNDGGGIYASPSAVLFVANSEFDSNVAGMDEASSGGAIFAADGALVFDSDFVGNSAYMGGAVLQESGYDLTVGGSWFEGNNAVIGGGIVCKNTAVCNVSDSHFEANAADSGGGFFSSFANVWAYRNTFCFNEATLVNGGAGSGGGIYLEGGAATLTSNVLFENTASSSGGGVFVSDGLLNSTNNHYLGNAAASTGGGLGGDELLGLYTTLDSLNDLFAWNTAGLQDGSISAGPTVTTTAYDWFYANIPNAGPVLGDLTSFVDVGDPMLRNHNIGVCDPMGLVPAVDSPLIDAGAPGMYDLNGSPADIGAFGGGFATPEILEDADGDGTPLIEDCDDNDVSIGPRTLFYEDLDTDGFGGQGVLACWLPVGGVLSGGDCNDLDPAVGLAPSWWPDVDLDGYGAANTDGVQSCVIPSDGWVNNNLDCDDANPDLNPDTTWHLDLDGDGWGVAERTVNRCEPGDGFVADSGDCDDQDDQVHPGADEYCDNKDSDCDGIKEDDDAVDMQTLYLDLDGDGFGDADAPQEACDPVPGLVLDDTDCDDSDQAIYPGAKEQWYDGIDQDCDGRSDFDQDVDGFDIDPGGDCDDQDPDVYPAAEESIDGGTDNNCDGVEAATWIAGGGGCGCASGGAVPFGWAPLTLFLLLYPRRRSSPS